MRRHILNSQFSVFLSSSGVLARISDWILLSLPVVSNEYGATFSIFFIHIYLINGQNKLIDFKDQCACQHYLNMNLFVDFVFCLLSIDWQISRSHSQLFIICTDFNIYDLICPPQTFLKYNAESKASKRVLKSEQVWKGWSGVLGQGGATKQAMCTLVVSSSLGVTAFLCKLYCVSSGGFQSFIQGTYIMLNICIFGGWAKLFVVELLRWQVLNK